jgi:ABC-type bacteriocin/lantibiotic exporter with double-glycine peptidase domain
MHRAAWLACTITAATVSCSGPLHHARPEAQLRAAGARQIVGGVELPEAPGPEGCGAQARAAVVAHLVTTEVARTVAETLPWATTGATPVEILAAARRRGMAARIESGSWSSLRSAIERNAPCLVMLDVAPPLPAASASMHWSVVTGLARDNSSILLAAPHQRHYVVERDDFMERWSASERCLIEIATHAAE